MSTKTIPLGAVRVALTGAVAKSQSDRALACTVAMTRYEPLARCCGSHRTYVPPQAGHFGVMHGGELPSLIKRVQLVHGSTEVRKTWGQGAKALLADMGTGLMR